MIQYKIFIKVSDGYDEGGTDSTVEIQLVGESGKLTEWKILDHWFYNNFEQGSIDKFTTNLLDVGMPCLINIKIKHGEKVDNLACDFIKIEYKGSEKYFPIYTIINTEYNALGPDTDLPQNVKNERVRKQRETNLVEMKKIIKWNDKKGAHDGITNHLMVDSYDDLPGFLKRKSDRNSNSKSNFMWAGLSMKYKKIISKIFPITCLEDYHTFHTILDEPNQEVHEYIDWKTDEVFGWQILNGIYPLSFTILKKIPSYFNVNDDDVKHLLGDGKSLGSEIKAEKLFIADFHEMFNKNVGLVTNPKADGDPCEVPHAVCLYYINEKDNFVPICIQLKPNDRSYLHTADKNSLDWLLAKMWIRTCMGAIHEWRYHYLNTHGFPEPFLVASFRCLSTAHPIYKLLRPHLRTVASINQKGREVLIPKNSVINAFSFESLSVMKTFYKKLTLSEMNIPKLLHKNGVVPNKIPHYYFAMDTMKLWKIIENYISQIVNLFYKSDKDVIEDSELQQFAHESAHLGFGWQDGNTRGIPSKFENRDELVNLLTVVIATSSVQHAAVNFGQWDHNKFVPMNPPLMNLPPHKKGEATMDRIMKSLPTISQTAAPLAANYTLSQYFEDQDFLGEIPETWFFEEDVKKIQKKFQEDLKHFDVELEERNNKLPRKYTYQMPRNIPNSVGI